MNKARATKSAIDIAKVVLGSMQITYVPNDDNAKDIADFIETLASRLESMSDID